MKHRFFRDDAFAIAVGSVRIAYVTRLSICILVLTMLF